MIYPVYIVLMNEVIVLALSVSFTLLIFTVRSPTLPDIPTFTIEIQSQRYLRVKSDPFHSKPLLRESIPAPRPKPKITIRGLIRGLKGEMVILESERNELLFLKPGDEYEGIHILKITPRAIITRFNSKQETLKIW